VGRGELRPEYADNRVRDETRNHETTTPKRLFGFRGLVVRDRERSSAFYTKPAGTEPQDRQQHEPRRHADEIESSNQ
jgi:hypothetical protein